MDIFKGKELRKTSGEIITSDVETLMQGKLVGLFFCASWCFATKQFLEVFKAFSELVQRRNGHLVIVTIPYDKTEDEMWSFSRQLPDHWLTLSLQDEELIKNLQRKFKVLAVPKLIILSDDGSRTISNMGRKEVQDKGIAAYRVWYNKFKPPVLKKKLKGAVFAVMAFKSSEKDNDEATNKSEQNTTSTSTENTVERPEEPQNTASL